MPSPKAPVSSYMICVAPHPPYGIRVKPLLKKRLKKCDAVSVEQISIYRKHLRDIIGAYIGLKSSSDLNTNVIITLTEQNKKLHKISTASRNLAKALAGRKPFDDTWLIRLRDAIDTNNLDLNTRTIIFNHLDKKDILYNKFLDMLWPCLLVIQNGKQVPRPEGNRPDDKILPYLEHLASIRESRPSDVRRWADPHLYFLIEKLAPLWVATTGRTWKHSPEIGDKKRYHFYEWLSDVLTKAGCRGVTANQVNAIAIQLKIKK